MYVFVNPCPPLENSVDVDQLASGEASWSDFHTVFHAAYEFIVMI